MADSHDQENRPQSDVAYTVLARRYRPMQFDQCVGQEHVVGSLVKAIENNRVAHAYLFTGARGVGKTSTARIFARALNCVEGPTTMPCGACDICESVAAGDDVDVIEIDGASNRGIDEVRELRQGVNFRPSRARYKIYIIDEVHMLTKEAFNALLKTLEEPPAHAKFIFATTEPQKIPVTILSRCQRFDFAGIELPRIAQRLREIIAAEGMEVEEEAIEIIARRAGGSMRDSQSLLDQLLAFGAERLTAQDVHRVMGTAGDERVIELATAALAGDAEQCLLQLEEGIAEGVQLGEWAAQLLDYLRDLWVLGLAPKAQLISVPERLRQPMLEQTRPFTPERLLEMMDILAACRTRMRGSTYGRTLFEMAVVRLCRLDQFVNLADAMSSGPPPGARSAARPAQNATTPATPAPVQSPGAESPHKDQRGKTKTEVAEKDEATKPAAKVELSADHVDKFWQSVVDQLSDAIMHTMLLTVIRVEFREPNCIVAYFPSHAHNSKCHCEEPARVTKIEDLCSATAGKHVAVRFELSQDASASSDVARPGDYLKRVELARADPIVRKAEEVLGAKMLGAPQPIPKSSVRLDESDPEVNEA